VLLVIIVRSVVGLNLVSFGASTARFYDYDINQSQGVQDMGNVLNLQGLPEGVRELAEQMATNGSCISLLSVSATALASMSGPQQNAPAQVGTLGSCVSLISIS
jgi:hypothetical protein